MATVLENWVGSGRIADIAIVFALVELAFLAAMKLLTGRGLSFRTSVSLILPGLFLMLALRSALVGAPNWVIPGWLLAALAAHVADLLGRWRSMT